MGYTRNTHTERLVSIKEFSVLSDALLFLYIYSVGMSAKCATSSIQSLGHSISPQLVCNWAIKKYMVESRTYSLVFFT